MAKMSGVHVQNGVCAAVGHTPFVRLARLVPQGSADIYAKLEFLNPSGSVKDRIAAAIITDAAERGALKLGGAIVEATSGNTGMALAMIGAAQGYKVVIVMPADAPDEAKRRIEAYGGEIMSSPPSQGMAGAVSLARRVALDRKGAFLADQFGNLAGVRVHRETTGREILQAIAPGVVSVFVVGVGTGATLMGVGGALKTARPATRIVAVQPTRCPVLSGGTPGSHRIPGIGANFMPPLLRRDFIDEIISISDEDAQRLALSLAQDEGLFVGPSSGANVAAALQVAAREGEGKIVVTILPDTGERYARFSG